MRKLLMFVLLVFWSCPAFAQDALWSRTYGRSDSDYGFSVQQTSDGGYIVAGYTYSFGAAQVYLIKTDSLGDTLWIRIYGGNLDDYGYSVQQTTDGGYIVAAITVSSGAGNWDVYLIRTDSNGDTLWTRTYGGSDHDEDLSVQQTADGGYIVAGLTGSFGAGAWDVYLIKTDSLGDTLWTRTYGGSNGDVAWSVQQTTDGGYIVAGRTHSFGAGGSDVYLIKTDSIGDTLWTHTYGGSDHDEGRSVQQTRDGGYIVAGDTYSFGAGLRDVYLIRTDSLGNTLWTRTYGGGSWDDAYCVQQTSDGGYLVGGHSSSFGDVDYADVYLIKTDSNGYALWSRTYGGSRSDRCYSVRQTADGGHIVGGSTESFGAGGYDVMLTKLDASGNACIGEFVSSTVKSVSSTVTSPVTVVTSPATVVTSPWETMISPPTEVTTVCAAIRGDCSGDGILDIADVVCLINYLFLGTSAPEPLWLGDCNCDGQVDIADVISLINYLFLGTSPPGC